MSGLAGDYERMRIMESKELDDALGRTMAERFNALGDAIGVLVSAVLDALRKDLKTVRIRLLGRTVEK